MGFRLKKFIAHDMDDNFINEGEVFDFSKTDGYIALVGLNGSGKTSLLEQIASYAHINPENILRGYCGELNDKLNNTFHYSSYNDMGAVRTTIESGGRNVISHQYIQFVDFIENRNKSFSFKRKPKDTHTQDSHYLKLFKNRTSMVYSFNELSNLFDGLFIYTLNLHKSQENKLKLFDFIQTYLEFDIDNVLHLSEGELKIREYEVLFNLIANEDNLILLDEPDANLDYAKKLELLKLIENFKGQVVLTTHDPYFAKRMKDHVYFMDKGKLVNHEFGEMIKKLSVGEVSYQETLAKYQKDYLVIVEGKDEVNYFTEAINKLGFSDKFKNVALLPQFSAGNVEYYINSYINIKELEHTKGILFVFDGDSAGFEGMKKIQKMKEDATKAPENIENLKKQITKTQDALTKNPDKIEIVKRLESYVEQLNNLQSKKYNIDFNKISYMYYPDIVSEDIPSKDEYEKYFYLEGFFNTKDYPKKNKIEKTVLNKIKDNNDDLYLNYNELERLVRMLNNTKPNEIKEHFERNYTDLKSSEQFEGFRPLLNAILKKLGID